MRNDYTWYMAAGSLFDPDAADAERNRTLLRGGVGGQTLPLDGVITSGWIEVEPWAEYFCDSGLEIGYFYADKDGNSPRPLTPGLHNTAYALDSRYARITVGEGLAETFYFGKMRECRPIYGDDMRVAWEKEQSQRFFRAELSQSLVFVLDDYKAIVGAAFETEFLVRLYRNNMGTPQVLFTGLFGMTDCKVDVDSGRVEVKPAVRDAYTRILDGWEREYDLMRLGVSSVPVQVVKRPLLQFYTPGDSVVSCFLGGMTWDMDAANPTADIPTIENTYHFGLVQNTAARLTLASDLPVRLNAGVALTLKAGTYSYEGMMENGVALTGADGTEIEYYETAPVAVTEDGVRRWDYENGFRVIIKQSSTSGEHWYYVRLYTQHTYYDYNSEETARKYNEIPRTIVLRGEYNMLDETTNATFEVPTLIYARQVLNLEVLEGGTPTYELPDSDICMTGRNYRRVVKYSNNVVIVKSSGTQTEPTEWGVSPNGGYYVKPYLPTSYGGACYPVGRNMWGTYSSWYFPTAEDDLLEEAGRSEYTLKNAYLFSGVINALLGEVAPELSFDGTTACSEALYGSVNAAGWTLMATPKSNVTAGEYTQPAQTAKTTLKKWLDMAASVFRIYWFIDGGRLRMEHVRWFRNGGTYDGTPDVGYDATAEINPRSGKPWSTGTSKYEFEKEEMPERYETAWMDGSTREFDGWPLVMRSRFVQRDKVEDVTVADFTSNVDYMLLNPDAVSKDGFALLAPVYSGGAYRLPFVSFTHQEDGGVSYRNTLQNGFLAMCSVQPQWWLWDLPCRKISVNGQNATALGVSRRKRQNITLPVLPLEPETDKMVKTGLGYGEIESFSLNLSTESADIELAYDTEQQ